MILTLRERAEIAQSVAAVAEGLDEVVRLEGGASAASTYYPGGKTDGVIIHEWVIDLAVEVHVVIRSLHALAVAARVRVAVEQELRRLGHSGQVTVVVEDLEFGEPSPDLGEIR